MLLYHLRQTLKINCTWGHESRLYWLVLVILYCTRHTPAPVYWNLAASSVDQSIHCRICLHSYGSDATIQTNTHTDNLQIMVTVTLKLGMLMLVILQHKLQCTGCWNKGICWAPRPRPECKFWTTHAFCFYYRRSLLGFATVTIVRCMLIYAQHNLTITDRQPHSSRIICETSSSPSRTFH